MKILLFLFGAWGMCVAGNVDAAKPMLIDLRSPEAFAEVHIPRALNMSFQELADKGWLRNRALILIGDGLTSLDHAMNDLRGRGFKDVSALPGGLRGYHAAGGALVGNGFAVAKLPLITPSNWLIRADPEEWSLIDLTEGVPMDGADPLPEGADLATRLRQFLKTQSAKRILFVDTHGEHQKLVLGVLNKEKATKAFYLKGGKAAFALATELRNPNHELTRVNYSVAHRGGNHAVSRDKQNCGCGNK